MNKTVGGQVAGSKSIWQSWSGMTRFSVIAFAACLGLTFLSLGALGYLIYYLVAPLMMESIDQLQGDSVWPSVIMAGLVWSFGFLLAGWLVHYLKNLSKVWRYLFYILVLWVWDYIIWFGILYGSAVE